MVRVKIVDGDLKILDRGYIWLGLRSWIVILRSWDVDTYKVRAEILYGDLELAIVEFDLRH